MASCGCATGSSKKSGEQDPLNLRFEAKYSSGFNFNFLIGKKTLPIKKIRVPNVLIFGEDPCLSAGDGVIVINKEQANCIGNFASDCYTVQSAPTAVGTEYEVIVDASWTSSTPTTLFQSVAAYNGCGTTAATQNPLSIQVCAGQQNPANWSAEITNRPLNSAPIAGAVIVTTGSPEVLAKDKRTFRPRVGDLIELKGTAITGANEAIVLSVAPDGIITLDRDVTGVSVPANPTTGEICVRAAANARVIARPIFTGKCKCIIQMILDKAITSSRTFPPGTSSGVGQCPEQEYCITILDTTPGAEIPYYSGILAMS